MRITDLLDRRSVSLTAAPKGKSEALDMAVDLMVKSEKISDREAYRKQVYLREEESTTGIGEGIAIPHGKCDAVKKPGLAAMVIKNGVEFEALDDEPVTLLFLIAAPNTEDNIHLDVLSKLSEMLMSLWIFLIRLTVRRKILMRDWQIPDQQKEHRLRSLLLLPVLQVSHIRTWQQKELKKLQKQRTVL